MNPDGTYRNGVFGFPATEEHMQRKPEFFDVPPPVSVESQWSWHPLPWRLLGEWAVVWQREDAA